MNPLAFSFRSSPRTSALAVVERETALGSPPCGHRAHTHTHTHRFPSAQESPGRSLSLFPVFPLATEPQYPPPDHPGGAGSETIGRNPITHTKPLLSPFFCVCCVPPTHHTHTCIRFPFHSCYRDCPVPIVHFLCCVFSNSHFRIHGAIELRTLHLNFTGLLSFVSSINLEYDNPESETQEPGQLIQKPGPA